VTAPTTLAILLGGSTWPKSPQLAASAAFAASARGFREYLTDARGFGLPASNVLDLFDSAKTAPEIVEDIQNYLRQRMATQPPPRDVFLYYTGHGGFISGRDYFLAVRSTIEGLEGTSSIRVSDLASALRNGARDVRRFLILDCCFAAAAFKEFQSTPGAAARLQTLDAFPRRGTTLLCSSSSRSVSIAPEGEEYTMFSGALLDVLRQGDANLETPLSLEDVGLRVGDLIRHKYDDRGVRPEVHSPDQRDEDIARMPVFPNAGGAPVAAAVGYAPMSASSITVPAIETKSVATTATSRMWMAGAAAGAVVIAVLVALLLRRPVPETKPEVVTPPNTPTPTLTHDSTTTKPPETLKRPNPAPVQPSQTQASRTVVANSPTIPDSAPVSSVAAKPVTPTTVSVNGSRITFANIPPGEFRMGCSPSDTDCQDDEKPVRRVSVGAFQMGTTEVTQEQWQAVMSSNPSDFKGGDSRPVEHISWNDAQNFLERLNDRRDGFTYRLPTEGEWEYAARANSAPPVLNLVAVFGLLEATGREPRPQRVGSKAANSFGLFDMLGNVAEWCEEWYSPNYQRVIRGGSWQDSAKSVRVSARVGAMPGTHDSWIGMRIVREPKS
jgi:formylglycine-generating enzyme required for sulfatase activity